MKNNFKRWKNLKECRDFNELRKAFSEEILDDFEKDIAAYESGEMAPEDATLIVHWYEGAIDTEMLILEYATY